MQRARFHRCVTAAVGIVVSLTALVGLVAPADAATLTGPVDVDPLAVTPASILDVATGEVIAIPTAATIDRALAVPQVGVPLGTHQAIPDLGLGPASVGGCWFFEARYIVRNTYNQAIYEYWDKWQWCSSNGTTVTSLPHHTSDVEPRNGFVNYGWRSWTNGSPGGATLSTQSKGNCYYEAFGTRYNYYPTITATLYPDGTITGVFTY